MDILALLTLKQKKILAEREEERQKTLKEKAEKQFQKEKQGEPWREDSQKEELDEIELVLGSEAAPKILDIKDLYEYFNPKIIYTEEDGSPFKFDYDNFKESEDKYNILIKELDTKLNKMNSQEYGENTVKGEKPLDETISDIQRVMSQYFNRFVPVFNKLTCSCCGKSLDSSEFYTVYSPINGARLGKGGTLHTTICKECATKLFMFYYLQVTNKNLELAMQYVCCDLNLFWDVDILYQAKKEFEDQERKGSLLGRYIKLVNSSAPGCTFKDSSFLEDEQYTSTVKTLLDQEYPSLDWKEEDVKNQKEVIDLLGYDPFIDETNENDRRILYNDLLKLIDEELKQDYVKIQSAVTIVKSFTKVRQLEQRYHQMEQEGAALKELQTLADLKGKELKAINDFSRDSGFSERFKSKQSKGETSFTGILKKMNEKKYENELVNKYDIETSATIQQAADASFNAIFNQLNISEAEYAVIASQQLAELRKLRSENATLKEDLRKARYSLAEYDLQKELNEE